MDLWTNSDFWTSAAAQLVAGLAMAGVIAAVGLVATINRRVGRCEGLLEQIAGNGQATRRSVRRQGRAIRQHDEQLGEHARRLAGLEHQSEGA